MNIKSAVILLCVTLILAACAPATPAQPTPDVNAIRTSAAYTVVAEFTLTAAVFTATTQPTDTPVPVVEVPTETPTLPFTTDPTQIALGTPGELCDNSSNDPATVDVTIPDDTVMTPGQEFVKTWRIKNTGPCPWGEGYKVLFSSGERMSGVAQPLTTVVQTGQEVEVSVSFKAPAKLGSYSSTWTMSSPNGYPFGKAFYVRIIVQ
jgi:hypothetical protein